MNRTSSWRLGWILCVLCGVSSSVYAQGGTGTVNWDQANVANVAQAQSGLQYVVIVTPPTISQPGTPVPLTGVTCNLNGTLASCSAPLPTAASGALITGANTILRTTDPATGKSADSLPFGQGPSAPMITGIQKP